LDVSRNTVLRSLWVNQNHLTSLNVSNNTKLENLDVRNNQFTASALNALFESLPIVDEGFISICDNPGTNYSDRSIAKSKGWFVEGGVGTIPNIYLIGEITQVGNSFRATVRLTCTAGRLSSVRAFAICSWGRPQQNIDIPNSAITKTSNHEWIVLIDNIPMEVSGFSIEALRVSAETNDGGRQNATFEIDTTTPLGDAQNFEWQRTGTTQGTGLAEFGLMWTATANDGAIIRPDNAERFVQLPANYWTFITTQEALADAINPATEIDQFRVGPITTGHHNLNYVLGVKVNGEYIMIHITNSSIVMGDAGSVFTITGQHRR
jgi:hypothetical protein